MAAFDDIPFPDYSDHGQVTTTIGDLKEWLLFLEDSARRNNVPRDAFSDETEIHIGRSYQGHAEIFVMMPSCKFSFGFFDAVRDLAFYTASKAAFEFKRFTKTGHQLAYRDAWKDYPDFDRNELDQMFGGPA